PDGSSDNFGVSVSSGGEITAGGSGAVTVVGTGGKADHWGNSHGVIVDGTGRITSSGGDVSVTGTGGSGSGNGNFGIWVAYEGEITAGDSGAVSVAGTGGNAASKSESGYNYGVFVLADGRITSGGGDVSVTGTGGGSGETDLSSSNHGVAVGYEGEITAVGSGTVTVVGTGGNAAGAFNAGVYVSGGNSLITSSGGDVSVTGTGGGSGDSGDNYGVHVQSGGEITAGGDGTVTVVGTGGNATNSSELSNNNFGVFVESTDGRITSSGGDLSVTGTGGSGSSSVGIRVDYTGQIVGSTGTPTVTLTADSIELFSDTSIDAGSNTVIIRPKTDGTLIDLGGTDVLTGNPLTLGLTSDELNRITAATLQVGDSKSGNITVSTPLPPLNVVFANLVTGGAVSVAAGGALALAASQTVDTFNSADDTTVNLGTTTTLTASSGTFSGDMTGDGNFTKTGAGTFTFTVDSNSSYTGTTTVSGGTLVVNSNLTSSSGVLLTGGILGGSGTVPSVTATGGSINPGNSPGILNVDGDYTLNDETTQIIELTGTGNTAGTHYDQVVATGAVSLGDAILDLQISNFAPPSGSRTFTIITGASVTGEFAGLSDLEIFTDGVYRFQIDYTANSVELTLLDPLTVFVNADWGSFSAGQDPDGAGAATAIGYDAFATLTAGITAVAATGTVNVDGDDYSGEGLITVAKDLSLVGSGTVTVHSLTDTTGFSIQGNYTASAGDFTFGGGTLTLTNTTSLTANGKDVAFNGAVSGTGHSLTVDTGTAGGSSIAINDSLTAGTLSLTSASITDGASGSLVVSGTTTLAGGTVLLDSSSNDFGSVTIATAQNVLLQDANSFTLNASTVNNGFELGGGTANLNGTLDVGGTLTVSGGTLSAGAHTIEVGGDVVFTGGNFSAGSSTLLFDGNTEQQLTANGQTVHHVTVDGGGNTLQLTESLSLTGNFNNQDSFDANGQSVTFSGSGTQTVTGAGGSNGFAAVTVAPGSTVQLGSAMLVASLTLQVDGSNAAQVALDSQTLTLNGLLTLDVVNSGAGVAQISGAGALSLGGSQRTFDIEDNAGSVALNIVSVIDNGSILKTGAGTLEFSGSSANTYTGTTTVNAGTLRLNKTSATAIAGNLTVGDGTGTDTVVVAADNQIHEFAAITLKSGGTLTVLTDVVSTVGSLTFEGGGSIDLQGNTTWLSLNGNVAFTGITGSGSISGAGIFNLLGASRTFTVADSDAAQDLVISTTITNGGVVKDGAGTLRLSGPDNSYVGTTTVTAGVLELAGGTAIHDSAQVDVNGGTLSVLASETVTTLNAVDGAIVSLGSSTTLTVSSGSFAGDMTGSGGFTKTGGGTFTFTSVSSNDYAGTTTVSGGTLLVNGSLAAGGAVQVASGATLGGSGSVGDVTVASGGFLAPGTSIETLEVVDLDQSGTLTIELTGDSDEPVAGTDYDQVIASGTITLSGTLVIAPSSFTAPLGTTYTIIKNNGASSVIGAFSNAAEDEEFESGGRTWKVNYNVGDDEDVVLTLLNTAPTVANEIPNQPFGAAAGNWTFQFEPDTFADVDGQTLTYTAQLTGSIPLPSWLDFDGETRTFTGNPPFDAPTSLSIEVTANDGAGGTVTDTFTLTLAPPLNDSPDLNSAEDVTLNGVQEDAPGPLGAVGTLVSALVDLTSPSGGLDNVTDPDGPALGVAIVGANTANGTWHYSLDDGDNWIAFATHGTLSESKALLLDASARIYFVPGLNFNGTISNAITFRAWDQSQGTASGTTFDVDSIGTGNGCAFSGAFDTAEIIVSAVNDAPAVTDGATHNLASTNENTTSSATPVSTILTGVGYEEFDAGDSSGIAVTAATGNGAWEFLVSGGSTWTAFGAVSGTTALLLASDTQVRYVPDGENGETATFSFRAWDRTTDSASTDETPSYATPGAGGGATAYSLNSANASITVTPDNDAPELSDTTVTLNAVAEDAAPPVGAVGTLVSSLVSLGGNVSDVDTGAVTGVAVIAANTTNGSWFYTTNGSDWNGLGAVTGSTARLLAADGSTRIYFQPSDHFNGTVSEAITFRAWDRTQGANGDIFDAAANVGSPHAFSTATDTASITVTAVNDAPVVAGSSAVTLAAIGEDTTEPAGATVDDLFAARFSDAADQVSGGSIANEFYGIAIIGSAVDAAQGQWQYFDGSWLDVGERGLTNALVVTAGNSLRFVPAENFNGTPNSLTVVLIDDSAVTGPENGSEVDLTGATGGTTAYSDATDEALTLSTSVTAVNDVPSFALPGDPDQTVAEDS
ncbi:MAG: autotransporter-associated beta strand repeat-containing protein, partial [Planctomycetia bacterium]|nr:autotransporter-associated beta strand repeat-containing protein [Planctomycetia bacterium]